MQCLQFRKRGSLLPKILHLLIIIFPASTRKYVTSSARSPLAISKFASLGIGQGRGKQNGKGVQECSHSFIMWFCIDGRLQCIAVNMLDIWRERKWQKASSFLRIGKQVVGRRYHCKSPLVRWGQPENSSKCLLNVYLMSLKTNLSNFSLLPRLH